MGATIRIMSGVPFDSSYTHTRLFATTQDQLDYFNTFTVCHWSTDFNQVKLQGRGYVDVRENFATMEKANYLYFTNPNIDPKTYYCFVTDVQVLTNDTTRVYFIRDLMQTWMFDYTFSPSLIEREHVAPSSTRNILPEPIQLGNEYETVATDTISPQDNMWLVVACRERFDTDYLGGTYTVNINNNVGPAPDTLSYYLIPFTSVQLDFTLSLGTGDVSFPANAVGMFLGSIGPGGNNAAQSANNIVNIYVTEFMPLSMTGQNQQLAPVDMTITIPGAPSMTMPVLLVTNPVTDNQMATVSSSVYANNLISGIDNEKLNYYPFTKIEIYDSRGQMMSYKPEGLPDDNSMTLQFAGSIGQNQSMFAGLLGYNGDTSIQMVKTRALINNSSQDIAILTDYLAAFLQGNKNVLENQREFLSDDLEYNQQVAQANRRNNWISTGMSAALTAGAIMLAPVTGGMSVAAKAGLAGAGIAGNLINAASRDNVASMQMENLERVYDQNVSNIYARQEDLENKPPSVNAGYGNLNLLMGNGLMNYTIAIKRVRPQYISMAQDYFNMFGFSTNRLGVPVLQTRTNWNYWKIAIPNIVANFPNEDIAMIKEIYRAGITFWHTNAVQDYTQTNGSVS